MLGLAGRVWVAGAKLLSLAAFQFDKFIPLPTSKTNIFTDFRLNNGVRLFPANLLNCARRFNHAEKFDT